MGGITMSQPISDGGPAFPMGYHPEGNSADHFGMTIRDYFAAAALQGILSGADRSTVKYLENMRYPAGEMSSAAYNIADAMLKAREAK
jgi:hypothetical protein